MRAAMQNGDKAYFLDIKNSIGRTEKPRQLLSGLAGLISKVGYSSSFMEAGQDRDLNDAGYLWWVVNKGVLNTRTLEGELFKENLRESLRESAELIERKLRNQMMEFDRR